MDIENNLAIITGGASGLGAAAAKVLAANGAKIAIFDRNAELGEAIAESVSGKFYNVDVTSEEQVQNALDDCIEQFGSPRILVNSAGIARTHEVLDENMQPHSLDEFSAMVNVNLVGTFNCLRLFAAAAASAPPTPNGERGVIINVASIAGIDSPSNVTAYGASKAGVIGLTLGSARSLSKWGIRVVTIAPGLFDTPILSGAGRTHEQLEEAAKVIIPFPPRMGQPDEFGEMVVTIARQVYLNGEVIRLDGGYRAGYSPT